MIWLNGGPGCSSLLGLYQEIGPYVLGAYGTEFTYNNYTWNQHANLLFLESPPGVGFSINNDADYQYTDANTADDNYAALVQFLTAFTEYKDHELWITGESYAGMYIPWFANKVHDMNQLNSTALKINLKGVMVGNGVMDMDMTKRNKALYKFIWERRLVDEDIANVIIDLCDKDINAPSCQYEQSRVSDFFNVLNPYDIYGYCYPQTEASAQKKIKSRFHYTKFFLQGVTPNLELLDVKKFLSADQDPQPKFSSPCVGTDSVDEYLNAKTGNTYTTQEALHIRNPGDWNDCSEVVGNSYQPSQNGSIWIYEKLSAHNYSILIYSGDVDSVVSYVETIGYLNEMNLNITNGWRPWLVSNYQVGGYVTNYEGLNFTTVRGAGHMVPQYRREAAYKMFQYTLEGKDLSS